MIMLCRSKLLAEGSLLQQQHRAVLSLAQEELSLPVVPFDCKLRLLCHNNSVAVFSYMLGKLCCIEQNDRTVTECSNVSNVGIPREFAHCSYVSHLFSA